MSQEITQDELIKMIVETKDQLRNVLMKSGGTVTLGDKHANGGPLKKEEGLNKLGKKPEPKPEVSASDVAPESSESASATPPGPPGADASSDLADPSAGGDPAAGGAGDDMGSLVQAYSQVLQSGGPEALHMHIEAIKQVMGSMGGGADASASPAPAGGPPPMAGEQSKPVAPSVAMAMKSLKEDLENRLAKAEEENTALKATVKELGEFAKAIVRKPERKAVTSIDMVKAEKPVLDPSKLTGETLQKSLIDLARKDLTKSERSMFNDVTYKKTVKVDALKPLFDKYQIK